MAKTPKTRKKLDIATAQQADGALPSFTSVYELVGIKDRRYMERTFADYSARLDQMGLPELHDHAYNMGVVPSPSRGLMIKRLQERFLDENPDQRAAVVAERAKKASAPQTLDEQVEDILSRSR